MNLVSVVILGFLALTLGFVFYRLGGKKDPESERSRYGGKHDRPTEQVGDHLLTQAYLSGRPRSLSSQARTDDWRRAHVRSITETS